MTKIVDKLIEKAKESFVLAVEIYNKPTIKYRVEGFSFFICNAWELMLKAHLIKTKGEASIYFKDNPERTISLESCIRFVFTNDKDPLRQNLEKIIELRNTSTHFVTEEYEMVYVPLFQSCLFNFNDKMLKFHDVDVTDLISLNFLNLVVKEKALEENEVRAKYDGKIADKLLSLNNKITQSMENASANYAISIKHSYYITKNKDKATDVIAVDKNAKTVTQIIREIKNPNETHKYTTKKLCSEITKKIRKENIQVKFKENTIEKFTTHHFKIMCDYYSIKQNERWCFIFTHYATPSYTYSMEAIEFIMGEIKKDPENILNHIKERLGQKNKLTPGAKEF